MWAPGTEGRQRAGLCWGLEGLARRKGREQVRQAGRERRFSEGHRGNKRLGLAPVCGLLGQIQGCPEGEAGQQCAPAPDGLPLL